MQKKIEMPFIPELVMELKGLQEVQQKINVSIHKQSGGFDDRADSFMMSTIPFLDVDGSGFGMMDMPETERLLNPGNTGRIDKQFKIMMEEMKLWEGR